MAGEHLTPMSERSDSDRAELIAKAQASRKARKEEQLQYAYENYSRHWEIDVPEWKRLGSLYGVRLCPWYTTTSVKLLKKYAKKLGKNSEWIKENFGVDRLDEIAIMNPTASMLPHLGWMLEDFHSEMGN